MRVWLSTLAVVGIIILVGLLFQKELLVFPRFLTAAIGQIDIPTLRLWQNRGGFVRTLVGGSSGTDVSLIQRSFATDPNIYPQGIVSGYWGLFTQSAFLRFQNEYKLTVTGVFDVATRAILNRLFYQQLCPVADISTPDLSLAHITKSLGLPPTYVPFGLVDISKLVRTQGILCVQQQTADALISLFAAARIDGFSLSVCSGYRGPRIQEYIKNQYLAAEGPSALDGVALPYHSEHQLGTTVDITSASTGYNCAGSDFYLTSESDWLIQNAWRYGFNLSYPESMKDGVAREYNYEPWHWRFVGIPLSTDLYLKKISYGEFETLSTTSSKIILPY